MMTKEEFFRGSDPNDLETQILLEDSWNNRIEIEELNNLLSGKSYNSFDNIKINLSKPEEFRSKFHDFNNTPHGISYLTNEPISIFPYTGKKENGEKGYEYYADILLCENGSDVYHQYKTHPLEPHHLYFFYEKPDKSKMNFFGSFYAIKMGEYFKTLFSRKDLNLPSKINGKPFIDIKNLKDEAKYISQLTYTYDKNIVNPTSVYYALQREFDFLTGGNILGEIMGDVLSIPKEALSWCNDKLEEIKPKEKNYNADAKDFTPLLPIITPAGTVVVPVNVNTAAQFFENLGNNPFVQGAEAAFSEVWQLVTTAAAKVKDAVIEHLPDALKPLVTKISNVINFLKSFVQVLKDDATAMAENGLEFLKMLNAFNCGIINGIISLVQCLLMLLELLLSPTKDYSYQQFLKKRDLQEKIEDIVDWLVINVPVFLNGINDLRKSSIGVSDLQNAFDVMKTHFGKISRYTAAFYVGIVAFEVIINILLLIFTEGAGNLIKGETYLAKLWSLVKVITKETVSVVTGGISDLLAFLGKFIVKFVKACKNGWRSFIKWIEELLGKTRNKGNIEDLLEDGKDIEEVIIKANKKNAKDFSEFEALEFLKKYNFHGHYGLSDLKKIWARSMTLKFITKEMVDFVKTGSLLKMERRYLTEEMTFFANQVKNKFVLQTSKLIKGKNCLRDFDIANCGGEILNLDWQNIEIFEEGLDIVRKHLERFESVEANRKMINRLEKIIDGEIKPTDWDKRFYTHEIREYRRYKNLGIEDGVEADYDIWNHTHSSTLEDYNIYELDENKNSILYHPDVKPEDFDY